MENSMKIEQLMNGMKLTFNAFTVVLRVVGKVFAWTFGILAIMVVFMTRMW